MTLAQILDNGRQIQLLILQQYQQVIHQDPKLRSSAQTYREPLRRQRGFHAFFPLSAQCAWCRWHTVWRYRNFPAGGFALGQQLP